MLDARSLQTWLKTKHVFDGEVDGQIGAKTLAAIGKLINHPDWKKERLIVAASQTYLVEQGFEVGEIDGYQGPQTQQAFEDYIKRTRATEPAPEEIAHQPTVWPRQRDVMAFYGNVGTNQVLLDLPYPMRLTWNMDQIVKRMSLHKKVAPSADRVLRRALKHYGLPKLTALHLDRFSGSLNVRKMRGGSAWSMHSWGIAIDFDDSHNALNMNHTQAEFAKPAYVPWFEFWEAEGWISLGRERDFDWMHVQAARL